MLLYRSSCSKKGITSIPAESSLRQINSVARKKDKLRRMSEVSLKYLALVLLIISQASCGVRSGIVSGTTHFTFQTRRPEPDCAITLYRIDNGKATHSARSNDSGRFTIRNVRPGRYLRVARSRTYTGSYIALLQQLDSNAATIGALTGIDLARLIPDSVRQWLRVPRKIEPFGMESPRAFSIRQDSMMTRYLQNESKCAGFYDTLPDIICRMFPRNNQSSEEIRIKPLTVVAGVNSAGDIDFGGFFYSPGTPPLEAD